MKQSPRAHTRPRAIQASRHLRVLPHRHSGHVLPRRHTSYPTLAMIMLCVGVLLASWTRWVAADPVYGSGQGSYTVNVRIPGPAPSEPATITALNNATLVPDLVVTTLPLAIGGNCPVNTYETLYRNSVFSGVVLCDATGTYSLETDLFPGLNRLQVQDFSLTDVPGPLSNSVDVTYNPPTPPAGSITSGSTSSGPAAEPLIIKTQFNFQGYYRGEITPWNLDIEGGSAPYAISANWGDGHSSLVSRAAAGSFSLSHTYAKAGGYKGSYSVLITASDASGRQSYLQLLAIINNPPQAGGATKTTQPPSISFLGTSPDWLKHIMAYVWPGYGLVLLMLVSFWLGERREFQHLKPLLRPRRRAR